MREKIKIILIKLLIKITYVQINIITKLFDLLLKM